MIKQTILPRKVDLISFIFAIGDMGKKQFFQTDLKKSTFPSNFIFSEIWGKNRGFQISNKLPFPRNVAIYVDLGYSELGGHAKIFQSDLKIT